MHFCIVHLNKIFKKFIKISRFQGFKKGYMQVESKGCYKIGLVVIKRTFKMGQNEYMHKIECIKCVGLQLMHSKWQFRQHL